MMEERKVDLYDCLEVLDGNIHRVLHDILYGGLPRFVVKGDPRNDPGEEVEADVAADFGETQDRLETIFQSLDSVLSDLKALAKAQNPQEYARCDFVAQERPRLRLV
jgi:hypothetical protein